MVSTPFVPDFRTLDFDGLWKGRGKTTEVERRTLRDALRACDSSRVLEIGVGAGRLAPVVQEGAREYVAVDVTPQFLDRVPISPTIAARRICANVYRLPFVDGAFRAGVMVRVFGFLQDPVAALKEVARVLAPGGDLVVSYSPHPSVETFVSDLKVALARKRGETFESMTFSRAPSVRVRPSEFPAWSCTRSEFRSCVDHAGFETRCEWPTGLEDYFGLRGLPVDVFVQGGRSFGRVGGFPTRFALLHKSGPGPAAVPDWDAILACPNCRGPLEEQSHERSSHLQCGRCGRMWDTPNGILDARTD